MLVTLIRLDGNEKVTGQWTQQADQAHPEPGLIDVTGHLDGPRFMFRTRLPDGSFTVLPVRSKTRREELKEVKETRAWTTAELQDAIAELL